MTKYVIDYFELPTKDTEGSWRFFGEAFGFGHTDYGREYSEVTGAGVLGGLNSTPEGVGDTPVIGIRTDDINAAVEAITAAGGVIVKPVYDYPGGRRCFFREPGGSVLLLYCPAE